MKKQKLIIIVALLAAVGLVLAKRAQEKTAAAGSEPVATEAARPMPRLIDLGASKCIPCKAMAPILEDLKINYAEQFQTVFIDVWEYPDAAKPYNIDLIPTQIFLDAAGTELWRHEGFLSKEDILAKWKAFGVVN
jgi:thioredoxin 1